MIAINYLAVVVAAIAAFAVGAVWYSVLFGSLWRRLMGFTPERMRAMKMTPTAAMALGFVAQLAMAYVLAHFIALIGISSFAGAMVVGFWVWLGFQATILAHSFLWEDKPFQLYLLNVGQQLIATLVAAGVLYLLS